MQLPPYYQEQLLAVVPKFSGAIGIPSNILLMSEIVLAHRGGSISSNNMDSSLNDHNNNDNNNNNKPANGGGNPILRSLGGVAFFLCLDALGWFLSTWAVPAESGFAFASGNLRTCEFQGFLLQVVIGAPMFCCSMAFYFWLIVACHKTSEQLLKYERFIAPCIVTYAFGSAFFLLGLGMYNHIGAVCWVIGSPAGCENSSYIPHLDVECDRGNWAWLYGMLMFYGIVWVCIGLIAFFNVSIVWTLHKGGESEEAMWFAKQSFLYALAFVVTWAPSTTWSGLQWKVDGGVFVVDLLAAFFEPIGGTWNLLIFLRSRDHSRRRIMRLLCCECFEERDDDDDDIDVDGPPPPPPTPLLQEHHQQQLIEASASHHNHHHQLGTDSSATNRRANKMK